MSRKRMVLSIRSRILLLFILSLFISVGSSGILVFSSWTASARQSTRHIAERINEDIYNRMVSLYARLTRSTRSAIISLSKA